MTEDEERRQDVYRREPIQVRRDPSGPPLLGRIEFSDLPQTEPEAYDRIRKWAESRGHRDNGGWLQIGSRGPVDRAIRVFAHDGGVPCRQVQVGDTDQPIFTQTAEIVRRAAMEVIGQEQIQTSVDIEADMRAIVVRMRQSLVAFEIPTDRTTDTKTKIEQTESVPVSWWDHWKHEHPRLSRLLRLRCRRMRPINTVVRTDVNVTKNYSIEGVISNE